MKYADIEVGRDYYVGTKAVHILKAIAKVDGAVIGEHRYGGMQLDPPASYVTEVKYAPWWKFWR